VTLVNRDATLIRRQHLESLEHSVCDDSLESVYREQFLKNYATYLGLEWEDVRLRYKKEQDLYCQKDETGEVGAQAAVQSSHLWVTARIVRNSIIAATVIGMFGYLAFVGYQTAHPPTLAVFTPSDNLASFQKSVVVSGQTGDDAGVRINGQTIPREKDGSFSQKVNLSDGLNVIEVSAVKKYGREQTIRRKVIVQSSSSQPAAFQ
jgi:cytoskeletal protein RodZ